MASYASMLMLSKIEFAAKLKDGQFVDLHGFCKAVSISAKGSRTELEKRLLAYKEVYDSRDGLTESNATSTPERRNGRMRSPHRGTTVINWPVVAPFPSADAHVVRTIFL